MKKLLLIPFTIAFSSLLAQNIELRVHGGGTALINGTTITVVDTVKNDINQDVAVEIDAKSLYSSTKTIKTKKIELC